MAGRYLRAFEVVSPPFVERPVGSDEEGLLGWGSFGEGVGDIGAKHQHVLSGGDCIEELCTCLLHAVGVGFREDSDLARACRSVADASCLLPTVNGLNVVSPYEMKNCIIFLGCNWLAKHTLLVVLIQL